MDMILFCRKYLLYIKICINIYKSIFSKYCLYYIENLFILKKINMIIYLYLDGKYLV